MIFTEKRIIDDNIFSIFDIANRKLDSINNNINELYKTLNEEAKEAVIFESDKINKINSLSQEVGKLIIAAKASLKNIFISPLSDKNLVTLSNVNNVGNTLTLDASEAKLINISNIKAGNDSNFILSPSVKEALDNNLDTFITAETNSDYLNGSLIIELSEPSFLNEIYIKISTPNLQAPVINGIYLSLDGINYVEVEHTLHTTYNNYIKLSFPYQQAKYIKFNITSYDKDNNTGKCSVKIHEVFAFNVKYKNKGYAIYKIAIPENVYSIGLYELKYDSIAKVTNEDISVFFSANGNKWYESDNNNALDVNIPWDNNTLKLNKIVYVKIELTNNIDTINLDKKYLLEKEEILERNNIIQLSNIPSFNRDILLHNTTPITTNKTNIKIGETNIHSNIYKIHLGIDINTDNVKISIGGYLLNSVSSLSALKEAKMPVYYFDKAKTNILIKIPENENNDFELLKLDEWLITHTPSTHEEVVETKPLKAHKVTYEHLLNNKDIKILFLAEDHIINNTGQISIDLKYYPIQNKDLIILEAMKLNSNGSIETTTFTDVIKQGTRSVILTYKPIDNTLKCNLESYAKVPFIDGLTEFQMYNYDAMYSYDKSTNTIYVNKADTNFSFSYDTKKYIKLTNNDYILDRNKIIINNKWKFPQNYIIRVNYSWSPTIKIEKEYFKNGFITVPIDKYNILELLKVDDNDSLTIKYYTNIFSNDEIKDIFAHMTPEIFSANIGAYTDIV